MRWILIILLGLQAATCGQKGPLTLPESTALSAQAAEVSRAIELTMRSSAAYTVTGLHG